MVRNILASVALIALATPAFALSGSTVSPQFGISSAGTNYPHCIRFQTADGDGFTYNISENGGGALQEIVNLNTKLQNGTSILFSTGVGSLTSAQQTALGVADCPADSTSTKFVFGIQ
jgi:hypothetical protein